VVFLNLARDSFFLLICVSLAMIQDTLKHQTVGDVEQFGVVVIRAFDVAE
jgi:hypothetical protein